MHRTFTRGRCPKLLADYKMLRNKLGSVIKKRKIAILCETVLISEEILGEPGNGENGNREEVMP